MIYVATNQHAESNCDVIQHTFQHAFIHPLVYFASQEANSDVTQYLYIYEPLYGQ